MAVVESSNPNFDFSEVLMQRIVEQTREWEEFGMSPLRSPSMSPLSSLPPSPSSSPMLLDTHPPVSSSSALLDALPQLPPPIPFLAPLPQLPLSDSLNHSSTTDDRSIAPTKRDRKEKRKAAHTTARQQRRAQKAASSFGLYQVRERVLDLYVKDSEVLPTTLVTEKLKVDSKGFVGIDSVQRSKKLWKLNELVGEGSKNFRLIEWDGKTPYAIIDSSNRVIGVLAGTPDDEKWPDMCQEASQALESGRTRCVPPKSKDKRKRKNRRGPFFALQCGVSHGGGQKEPKNLYNVPKNQAVLDELNDLRPFKRVAGFASSVMACRAPLLYDHYADRLGRLFKNDDRLKKIFPSTIFAAATYNFGPCTVCYEHIDPGNLAYGWCTVTPFGLFDYTKGGHLVLWDCHLVIQFPPGSTILLPSAIVAHSNTAIQPDETRYSFALYSAGALFRWVENGCERSSDFYASLTEEERNSVEAKNLARWKLGLSLLPVIEAKVDRCASI